MDKNEAHRDQAIEDVSDAIINVSAAWAHCGLAGMTEHDYAADVVMNRLRQWLYALTKRDDDGTPLPETVDA